MKRFLLVIVAAIALLPLASYAEAVVGQPAPKFEAKDASGKTHLLTDYIGKWIVLEWFNKDCPFVKKHYGSKNMQALQGKYVNKGVVWLTVNSAAQGKQGYQTPEEALQYAREIGSAASALIMDTDGKVGKAYGATATPHMFIIDPKGTLVYAGAIDDNDSANPKVIKDSRNYVASALEAGMVGGKIDPDSTKPYGCAVKY